MTPSGSGSRPALAARVRAEVERRLDAQELAELLAVPVDREEREDVLSLVGWFRRRYPSPADRLAYVRRAYQRWTRSARKHG